MHSADPQRTVILRSERNGSDQRYLRAYLDEHGNLHLVGQDLGPATAIMSADGEYEWSWVIKKQDVPNVVALLGGSPGDDILDILERGWTGARSGELEQLLGESNIPRQFASWSG